MSNYYGAYSNVVRGKLRKRAQAETQATGPFASEPGAGSSQPSPPPPPSLAALRRGWAPLIRQISETDPFVCPRCRTVMRVVSFITEPRTIRCILDHLTRRATQGRAPPSAAAGSHPLMPIGQET